MFLRIILHLCVAIYPIFAQADDAGKNYPQCPTVMCLTPCPAGQYLVEVNGCETCDCYDPCNGVECEKGSCHWKMNEKTRPETFCAECTGGQEWTDCGGGSECLPTCQDPHPLCPRNCYSGCQCPLTKPVWDQGKCITADECNSEWLVNSRLLDETK